MAFFAYGLVFIRGARRALQDLTSGALATGPEAKILLDNKIGMATDDPIEDAALEAEKKKRLACRKEATGYLRKASAIFEFSKRFLQDFVFPPGTRQARPPDTHETTLACFADMSLALGQELAVQTAIDLGKSPSTIAKLCLGVANAYTKIRKTKLPPYRGRDSHCTINLTTRGKAQLYAAMARKFLYIDALQQEDFGKALAWIRDAKRLIVYRNGTGVPFTTADIQRHFVCERRGIEQLLAMQERDQQSVFFAPVPTLTMHDLPTAVFMMQPLPMEPRVLARAPHVQQAARAAAAGTMGAEARSTQHRI